MANSSFQPFFAFFVYFGILGISFFHLLIDLITNMIPKSLTAASTKLIILGILREGNSYGYLIIKKVKELSGGKMNYSDGMLYPVLHHLEKEGFIKSEWVMEDEQRPRKYYALTAQGKNEFIAEREHWTNVHAVLEAIWQLNPKN